MTLMFRFFYFLLLLIACSCSNTESPGYQEPFDPDADQEVEEPLSDEELLEKVQEQTFNYFWDFAGTNSGLARERSQDDAYGGRGKDIVTIGGSGFGLAAFPVAVERGWITREQAIERLNKILDFLEKIPTYHGAFSHWYLDSTGQTQPFGSMDDGGDLVETAFLIQGLLINRQYFTEATAVVNRITELWEAVEWDWYTKNENVLYWHWSPTYNFQKNLKIQGWNESLIIYVLAAASPTYPITPEVYHQGWASSGGMVKNRKHYNLTIPLGPSYGGPLFFSHYSFIGLDPRNLEDEYANYWSQNQAHSLVHYNYAIDNPKNFKGYGENCWGFTASDNYEGYSAHSPANDLGVITPTAALSSFPYTPEESMKALRYFYEEKGNELWGPFGFYDAFSEEENWVADGYLAIDQGPIISMIENYRTGLLWNLFMQDAEVKKGLDSLDFTY